MSMWQGANLKRPERRSNRALANSTETVEAALNRLSKLYQAAMDCVGSWHRRDLPIHVTVNVGRAARNTLTTILRDPLIAIHGEQWTAADGGSNEATTATPVVQLRSTGHKETVKQLAYLSLVNYGDLLLSGIPNKQHDGSSGSIFSSPKNTLLDRGVVRCQPNVLQRASSCWETADGKTEAIEDTVRLAVVAYIDAAALDGSDPTVWLKLACAARRLDCSGGVRGGFGGNYGRLEQHSLEHAVAALPAHEPPNRTAVRALDEWRKEQQIGVTVYSDHGDTSPAKQPLLLELPRYSWSTLGRTLLRACKEGGSYTATPTRHAAMITSTGPMLVSPCVQVKLSPLLVLPTNVMATVCSYLEPGRIWKFEATCRAMSSSVISARALLDNNSERKIRSVEQQQARQQQSHNEPEENKNGGVVRPPSRASLGASAKSSDEGPASERTQPTSSAGAATAAAATVSTTATSDGTEQSNNNVVGGDAAVDDEDENNEVGNKRISKRVQSQIITSGKRTERSSRRNSTQYCLLAATLSCTAHDKTYKSLLNSGIQWTSLLSDISRRDAEGRSVSTSIVPTAQERDSSSREEALARLKDSSLSCFVERCSNLCLSPLACMFKFVAHTSLHIADVFFSDPGGSLIMSACLLDCIILMARRTRLGESLTSSWSASSRKVPRDANLGQMELFAIDLLHAELRLKRCDGEELVSFDFDSDGNFVSTVVPYLVSLLEDLTPDVANSDHELWQKLRVRCLWLTANFYFWRGRLSSNVGESREAERGGLEYMEETKQCLQLRDDLLSTPHLVSPKRRGQHWKELSTTTLSTFSDEIQASSIVLLSQEQFLEATAKFSIPIADQALQKEDCHALCSIGMSLLERYNTRVDSPSAKHSELIDDFLGVHGDKVLSTSFDERQDSESGEETIHDWFDGMFPSELVESAAPLLRLSSPCTLSILATCLQTKQGYGTELIRLLMRLVITLVDLFRDLSSRQQGKNAEKKKPDSSDEFSDSDDDESLSDDDDMFGREDGQPSRAADRVKMLQYATTIQLLLSKMRSLFLIGIADTDRVELLQCEEFTLMLHCTLAFSAEWFQCSDATANKGSEDLGTFLATQGLFKAALASAGSQLAQRLTQVYLLGMIHIVVAQRRVLCSFARLKPSSKGRADRLKTTRKRADLVAAVCCDAGLLLSQNLVRVSSARMERSELFLDSGELLASPLALFCDSLAWLWKAASSSDANTDKSATGGTHLASYLDRFGRDRLRVPIATAIIGLCGSASSTDFDICPRPGESNDQISLIEFYDSDASATEWLADADENEHSDMDRESENLLRVCMQAVHCVCHVFGKIEEKEAVNFLHAEDYVTKVGPCLPLVVSRVLNRFAHRLLVDFRGQDEDDLVGRPLWSDYPVGTRVVGLLLDSMLCKAYKCLHGFTLLNASDAKESSTSGGTNQKRSFLPESKEAGAMLYRCIMRAYSQGRKYPPKAALETVLASLPELKESAKSVAIRRYLLSSDLANIKTSALVALVAHSADWKSSFAAIKGFDSLAFEEGSGDENDAQDESMIVRRGLSRLIAQGPLPQFQDSGDENDTRSSSSQAEDELSRKFVAIIDDLCFGDTNDCEGWFKASQCLSMKADIVADRLGLTKGFARNLNFYVSERVAFSEGSLELAELQAKQEREKLLQNEGWVQCLGTDLSPFVKYSWTSFSDLKSCSVEVGKAYTESMETGEDDDKEESFDTSVWREIDCLFSKNDFTKWQQAWGGLFVSSLRKTAYRCLFLALYTAYKKSESGTKNSLLISEIIETLGVSLYSELMGSQMYGYPMKEMPSLRKREIAEAAEACFSRAVTVVQSSEEHSTERDRVVWDLLFMIGKCREKIAGTYSREVFPSTSEALGESSEAKKMRTYERQMALALQSYAASLAQAKEEEGTGGFIAEQNGGSAHGVVEIVYRLHASRLKCLIAAVDRREDERVFAEQEALRLTECHWYVAPDGRSEDLTLRERVWRVFVDVVTALAKCRLDNSYFHRSVYRHAQALMWAPVLYDPVAGRTLGSLGTVSATWANKIRGLNYATNAASSAVPIIGTLFEKKRPQLVAVWVTGDGTTSTLQTINNSVRKYDSLRGKYISAYIDNLRLCGRRKELDTFLRWAWTAKRDLPAYFTATALTEGGKPQRQHTVESLLLKSRTLSSHHFLASVKREANSALASVVLCDMRDAAKKTDSKPESAKAAENQLKLAYACYLRLNCKPDALTKSRAWKYNRKSGVKDVVEALTTAYLRVAKEQPLSGARADWSGESHITKVLKSAIGESKKRFPSLSGSFSFSKTRATPKKKAEDSAAGSKRKVDATEQSEKTFEVAVPEGLNEGDTFLSSIKVGEELKTIRLTVPKEAASTLRFSFPVPTSLDPEAVQPSATKKSREVIL